MAWFRVDDGFHGHPKTRESGLAAIGLWTVAGSYSRAYGLGGRIPQTLVSSWSARRQAETLVASGLWAVDGDGWRFHDWDDFQPSIEEEQAVRAAARRRQREHRQRACDSDSGGDNA